MYDSQPGKFLSEDPKGFEAGYWNLTVYVGNNPFNLTDPTGMSAYRPTAGLPSTEGLIKGLGIPTPFEALMRDAKYPELAGIPITQAAWDKMTARASGGALNGGNSNGGNATGGSSWLDGAFGTISAGIDAGIRTAAKGINQLLSGTADWVSGAGKSLEDFALGTVTGYASNLTDSITGWGTTVAGWGESLSQSFGSLFNSITTSAPNSTPVGTPLPYDGELLITPWNEFRASHSPVQHAISVAGQASAQFDESRRTNAAAQSHQNLHDSTFGPMLRGEYSLKSAPVEPSWLEKQANRMRAYFKDMVGATQELAMNADSAAGVIGWTLAGWFVGTVGNATASVVDFPNTIGAAGRGLVQSVDNTITVGQKQGVGWAVAYVIPGVGSTYEATTNYNLLTGGEIGDETARWSHGLMGGSQLVGMFAGGLALRNAVGKQVTPGAPLGYNAPAANGPAWKQYEQRFGGQQTPMTTTFQGKTVQVRLDKPPTDSTIVDFKHYNWSNSSYQKPFIQQKVTNDFAEQIGKYKTIRPNVHLQFSQQPPAWAVQAIQNAGGTFSVVP